MKNTSVSESKVEYQLKHGWKLKKQFMETPEGESQTIPDGSYEIKDLIKKYASGLDPVVSKLSNYDGEDDDVDYDDPDLAQLARADISESRQAEREAAARQQNLLLQMQESEKKKQELKGSRKYSPKEEVDDDLRHEDEEENTSKGRKKESRKNERSEEEKRATP